MGQTNENVQITTTASAAIISIEYYILIHSLSVPKTTETLWPKKLSFIDCLVILIF